MSDIVKLLRVAAKKWEMAGYPGYKSLDAKAADEIERLRKRVTEQEEFIDRLTSEPQSQERELEES